MNPNPYRATLKLRHIESGKHTAVKGVLVNGSVTVRRQLALLGYGPGWQYHICGSFLPWFNLV